MKSRPALTRAAVLSLDGTGHTGSIYIYISNVIINEYFESIQRDRDFAHPRDFYFLLLYHQKELKND